MQTKEIIIKIWSGIPVVAKIAIIVFLAFLLLAAGRATAASLGDNIYPQPPRDGVGNIGTASKRIGAIWSDTLQGAMTVTAKTSDYTLTEADNGTLFTNTGATGSVILYAPDLTTTQPYFTAAIANTAGYTLYVEPYTGGRFLSATAADDYLYSTSANDTLVMHSVAVSSSNTETFITVEQGTWTEE